MRAMYVFDLVSNTEGKNKFSFSIVTIKIKMNNMICRDDIITIIQFTINNNNHKI